MGLKISVCFIFIFILSFTIAICCNCTLVLWQQLQIFFFFCNRKTIIPKRKKKGFWFRNLFPLLFSFISSLSLFFFSLMFCFYISKKEYNFSQLTIRQLSIQYNWFTLLCSSNICVCVYLLQITIKRFY